MTEEAESSKKKGFDWVTAMILAIAVVSVALIGARYAGIGEAAPTPQVVVLNTSQALSALEEDSQMNAREAFQHIEAHAEALADQGYIVIRSDSVWAMPEGVGVEVEF